MIAVAMGASAGPAAGMADGTGNVMFPYCMASPLIREVRSHRPATVGAGTVTGVASSYVANWCCLDVAGLTVRGREVWCRAVGIGIRWCRQWQSSRREWTVHMAAEARGEGA